MAWKRSTFSFSKARTSLGQLQIVAHEIEQDRRPTTFSPLSLR